jgi:hypothetical protein
MKTLITIALLTCTLIAQERVLLRIGQDGQQEAIPLGKGESAIRRIEQVEQLRKESGVAGVTDTLKWFVDTHDFATNFRFSHQDVAFQWYRSDAGGTVKEFWWRNGAKQGAIKKGTIRAWHVNPRVAKFPGSPNVKYIGTYKDATDGDGGVQPFKPATGNQWFYSNGAADSVTYSFDMFTKESQWLPGGVQVTLDSLTWQGITLQQLGDSMNVTAGELFGFTLSNDTKKTDIGPGVDERLEIVSWPNTTTAYHSLKFYENAFLDTPFGWYMRGDYEWGMYVVIEYTGDRPPKLTNIPTYGTTLSTSVRIITATITDDNPGGGVAGVAVARVFSKIGVNAAYDSTMMNKIGTSFTGYAKASVAGDTVYWYIAATDLNGNRTMTPVRSYVIFKKARHWILIYNNTGFSRTNANLIYTGYSTGGAKYDFWSVPNDGISELPTLLGLYANFLVVDGSFPSHNVFTALKQRLNNASIPLPVALFITSQDYGCFIQQQCADTTFTTGSLEYDYLGLTKIGPQDVPPVNREFRVVPQADAMTNYLIKYGADSGSTLWCDPTFELGFSSYQDNLVARPGAKALLTDGGSNVWGVKYITQTTRSFFAGIDVGSLQFRSDTSLVAVADPKYKWVPTAVGALTSSFFNNYGFCYDCPPIPVDTILTVGDNISEHLEFGLAQNYPNPFNPVTSISYSVAAPGSVTITVYNAIGQRVAVLVNESKASGEYQTEWNAENIPSGLYFYEMRTQNYTSVKKMLLLK